MTTTLTPTNRLREVRRSKNLTLEQLGELTGVPYQTISRIENGHQVGRWVTCKRIAAALNVTDTDLFGEVIRLRRHRP
jgi:transcriptional regulator with XRE-family HTH domain